MTAGARILILGGGIAGLATAYHLARRGARGVLLIERERAVAQHSTSRSAAILRSTGEDAAVQALVRESLGFLTHPVGPGLEPLSTSRSPLVDGRGVVLLAGSRRGRRLAAECADALAQGFAQQIDPEELRRCAPGFTSPHGDATRAFLFADEGVVSLTGLIGWLSRGARALGVDLRLGARARELLLSGSTVRGVVLDSGERVAAETVVLAAGAWAGDLGQNAGSRVALRPTRRHLLTAFAKSAGRTDSPVLWDVEEGFYARCERGGWLLCACDEGAVDDPDRLSADPALQGALWEKASRYLKLQAHAAGEFWAGLRTVTSDGAFAIGPDPDLAGLFWVAGLAGSGIGAGFGAGRLAADLLLGDEDALAAAFSPARLVAESHRGP